MRKHWFIGLWLGGAALGLATAAGSSAPGAPPPATATPAPGNGQLCRGGDDGLLGVELEPAMVVAGPGGEGLAVDLRLRSRFRGASRVRFASELVDDRGRAHQAPARSSVLGLGAHGEHGERLQIPSRLADGFYKLRLTAVATGAEGAAAEVVQLHLRKQGGSLAQLSMSDWIDQSAQNLAVDAPEGQ